MTKIRELPSQWKVMQYLQPIGAAAAMRAKQLHVSVCPKYKRKTALRHMHLPQSREPDV